MSGHGFFLSLELLRNGHSAFVFGNFFFQCHLWELSLSPNQNFLTLKTLSLKFFLTWLDNKFLESFEILGLWNWNCLKSWIFYLVHLKELFVWKVKVLKGEMIKVYKTWKRINMNLFTKFHNITIRGHPWNTKKEVREKAKEMLL